MPFVKLDCGIVDSTLWADRDSREIFITALLMARPVEFDSPQEQIEVNTLALTGFKAPPGWYGFVEAAGPGIVRRAGLDAESGLEALRKLGDPDSGSRTPTHDGRRMIRVAGGYLILNYMNYRDKDYTAADRMRRLRERRRNSVTRNVDTVTRKSDVADAKAYAYTEAKNKSAPSGALFEEFWNAYKEAGGEKVGRGQAEKAWKKINPDHALLTAMLIALQSQKQERAVFAGAGQFYEGWKHPATWLNGKCWLDEPRTLTDKVNEKPRRLSGPELVERATAERKREREQKLISR